MGWLFAVALGLHRHSERIVLLALVPIALGHAAAVAAVLAGVLALGRMLDATTLLRLAAIVLTGCAVAHPASFHQRVKRDDHHDQNADDDRKPSRQQQHPLPHRHVRHHAGSIQSRHGIIALARVAAAAVLPDA